MIASKARCIVWKQKYPALITPFDLADPERASSSTEIVFAPEIKWYIPPKENKEYKLSEYLQNQKDRVQISLALLDATTNKKIKSVSGYYTDE